MNNKKIEHCNVTVPENLLDQIKQGNVVLWAGSGLSRYAGFPSGEELKQKLCNNFDETEKNKLKCKTLQEISEYFVKTRNRSQLMEILIPIFKMIPKSMIYHKKIYETHLINSIITTNYENLFELAYGEKNIEAIYTDKQIPRGISNKKVKLYKIHGDITDTDSIIITETDYRKFYIEKQQEILWAIIRAIVAQNTVLFIGYSFEDDNIRFLFEDIIKRVGKTNHNGLYLASIGFPEYEINHLKKDYGIQYIESKAEDLIDLISDQITKDAILDVIEDKTSFSHGVELLKQCEGWDIYTHEEPNSKKIEIHPQNLIPVTFTLKNNSSSDLLKRLQDFIDGITLEPLILSNDELKFFEEFEVGGKRIFSHKSLDNSKNSIEFSHQGKEGNGHLVLFPSGLIIDNIKYRHVLTQKSFLFQTFGTHFSFLLKPNIQEKQSISFELSIDKISDIIEGNTVFSFIKRWIEGEEMTIYTDHWVHPFIFPSIQKYVKKDFSKFINWKYLMFSTLFRIQKICLISFIIPDKICKKDFETILELNKIIFAKPTIKHGTISATIHKIPDLELLKSGFDFRMVTENQHRIFNLFNHEIILNTIVNIHIHHASIKNLDDIIKEKEKGSSKFYIEFVSSKSGFNFIETIVSEDQSCITDDNFVSDVAMRQ